MVQIVMYGNDHVKLRGLCTARRENHTGAQIATRLTRLGCLVSTKCITMSTSTLPPTQNAPQIFLNPNGAPLSVFTQAEGIMGRPRIAKLLKV